MRTFERVEDPEQMWAKYHSSLLAHLQSEIMSGSLVATDSRHVTSRLITSIAKIPSQRIWMSISDYEIHCQIYSRLCASSDTAESIQAAVRCEENSHFRIHWFMIRNAEDATSTVVECQRCGGLLSVISDLLPICNTFYGGESHHNLFAVNTDQASKTGNLLYSKSMVQLHPTDVYQLSKQ